jgi:hypothetical protein
MPNTLVNLWRKIHDTNHIARYFPTYNPDSYLPKLLRFRSIVNGNVLQGVAEVKTKTSIVFYNLSAKRQS